MGSGEHLAEVLDAHSCIELGALEALVAEELLDVADVSFGLVRLVQKLLAVRARLR